MVQRPLRAGLALACLVLGLEGHVAYSAPPTVPQMFTYRPRQDGIVCTTPSADEQAQCKVEPVKNAKGQTFGWMLTDGRKQSVRRFLDTNGDNKIDVWCYYKDGVEVYREIDSNYNDRADQFRWFNDGGMRWGVDVNEDGRIDAWRIISSEEVGSEVFSALHTRDFERLKALFINEAEMKALKLSPAQVERIKGQLAKASAKFNETIAKAKLDPKASFVRVESALPHCVPGDTLGMDTDLIRFPSRQILLETPSKDKDGKDVVKHDWLQTGEIIQVGLSWRLAEGPNDDDTLPPTGGNGNVTQPPTINPLLAVISKIDEEGAIGQAQSEVEVSRLLRRVEAIEKLLATIAPEEREQWIKQMLDNLGALGNAAYKGNKNAAAGIARLSQLKAQLEKSLPGSPLAGYATYRDMCAFYLPRLSDQNLTNLKQMQEEWHEKLTKFVQSYPSGEDAPEALSQLGIGSEFGGKEEEAKRWYTQIFTNFPDHIMAPKARGCVRRLNSIGQEMELVSTTINKVPFDIKQMRGKVVAVYYYANYVGNVGREFAILKQIQTTLGAKGVEIVCVNLDDSEAEAIRFLQSNPLQATHLFQPAKNGGGLNSPLATQYGINGLPTIFLIGRDGRVLQRTLQINDLEDALKKAL